MTKTTDDKVRVTGLPKTRKAPVDVKKLMADLDATPAPAKAKRIRKPKSAADVDPVAVAAPVKPKRPSRSKALAAQAAGLGQRAGAVADAMADRNAAHWTGLTDPAAAALIDNGKANVTPPPVSEFVSTGRRKTPRNDDPHFDAEIEKAVAALEDHGDIEVVRSLADIDDGEDPLAPAGIEEAALARLNKAPPLDGSPAQLLLELQYAGEALLDFEQLDEEQKRTIATLSARLTGASGTDASYEAALAGYDRVLQLEGEVAALESELTGARKNVSDNFEVLQDVVKENGQFRTELDRKDSRIVQLTAERDDFHRKASALEFELSREKSSNRQLNAKLLAVYSRGLVARLFNRAA